MRHTITIKGEAFCLRPVELSDAAFIVALRCDPRLSRFIGPTSTRVEDQERWIEDYFARPGDYYFIIERVGASAAPEGTVGIYDLGSVQRCAEWGRWVVRSGSLAASESALLVYRVAFEVLHLDLVYCRTLAANEQVVSFHRACGLTTHARLPAYITLGGVPHDAIEQRLRQDGWPACERILARGASAAARLVNR